MDSQLQHRGILDQKPCQDADPKTWEIVATAGWRKTGSDRGGGIAGCRGESPSAGTARADHQGRVCYITVTAESSVFTVLSI